MQNSPPSVETLRQMASEDSIDAMARVRAASEDLLGKPDIRLSGFMAEGTSVTARYEQSRREEWTGDIWDAYIEALTLELAKAGGHALRFPRC